MQDIELLSPAGSFETALAAFQAGADAVYLGLDAFSARADAVNFTIDRLRQLLAVARRANSPKKVYVTFNTVIDDADLEAAVEKLALLEEVRPDGLIVQDLGIARLVRLRFPSLELHASTQLVAHNLEGVLAMKELGFSRVVLAREMSLAEIRSITKRCGCEIEVFVHGALCYSISGLCLFSAMEKNRSGNRGRCAYCCRLPYTDAADAKTLPFSMRDLRLDECLDALRDAGVKSLKIEGRMKSPLYVASVTSHYRQILDGAPVTTTRADLETVFSRRTTTLYVQNPEAVSEDVIDTSSLGHLGTPVGTVKRLTRDREGRTWLRFHTNRALEKHDGLQFVSEGEKPFGFGISDMRLAIARKPVFEARPGSDVEILVPDSLEDAARIRHGDTVYCSASNEVKRRFPVPSFRPSDVDAGTPVDIAVTFASDRITATAALAIGGVTVPVQPVFLPCTLTPAQHPERTAAAARKAFERMGGTEWSLGAFSLEDPDRLFAPASFLNEVRRDLVEHLDTARLSARRDRIAAALETFDDSAVKAAADDDLAVLKLRLDQPLPGDAADYAEIVVVIGHRAGRDAVAALAALGAPVGVPLRLALPVFTRERDFNALRNAVKHLLRAGYTRWEAVDLATLRLLLQLGVTDLTADWTLYAFNVSALAQLAEFGIARVVASPENNSENLAGLARSVLPRVEFLEQQSTPLFISLTRPATDALSRLTGVRGDTFTAFRQDGLWITTRTAPRCFRPPSRALCRRLDLSWDPV